MKLTKKEVEHIAALARIYIKEEEKEIFRDQLSSVLDYVRQLQDVETTGVLDTSHATGVENVFRDDKVLSCDQETRDALLKNAPEVEDELIKTKSVFE